MRKFLRKTWLRIGMLLLAGLTAATISACGPVDADSSSSDSSNTGTSIGSSDTGTGSSDTASSDSAEPVEQTFTVTFRQEGQEDVVKTVKEGETLADVPAPVAVPGYTVAWDRTDFSDISEDIVVTAVQTANKYTITYDLGVNIYATLGNESTEVTFGQSFVLETPEYEGSAEFYGWYLADEYGEATVVKVEGGTYAYAEDVTVVARWQEWSEVVS